MPMTAVERSKYTKAIWATAREHNVDREGVYEAIKVGFNKTSVLDLTRIEAIRLITGLRGGKPSPNFNPNRRRAMGNAGRKHADSQQTEFLCNDREHEMLRDIAGKLGWDEAALQRFCERQIKLPAPRTMGEHNKVLWALKAISRRATK